MAVDQLRLLHDGRLQVGLAHVFRLTEDIWQSYTSDAQDLHANRAETSLMLHLHPALVHRDRLSRADDPDRTAGTVFSHPVARTSLNGVTGSPSLASAAEGEELFGQMCDALTEIIGRAVTEEPPLPPEHWKGLPEVPYD